MDIDLTRHLGMVDREVGLREHLGRPARVVTAHRTYDTSIDDLWDALTNAERIPRWFLPVSGELRLGGHYQLEGNAGGEITRCEPPRLLSVTWVYGPEPSWLTVELTALESESTRLQLEHVAHVPEEFWDQFGPGAVGVGWDLALMGLAEHLAGAPSVDRAAAELWPTTERGREYIAYCSGEWCRASIAAGTEASAAEAAAGRTTSFYTGAS
jgi:uncharacterized protein YndB with AHSA1/START domain